MLCALIMAGGKGTRFWPLSTEEKPKQFLNLIGEETMIQMTVNRIKPIIPIDRIFVCTGKKYVNLVKEQLPEIADRNIIVEPEGRNTAPCIALSAMIINRYYKNADMVVLPSDHLINKEDVFRNILISADRFINKNKDSIVTLGISPSRAETGYGYIKYGKSSNPAINKDLVKVNTFVEKPNKEKAEKYLQSGDYLWNGGMFLWNAESILNKIKTYLPNTYEALHNIETVKEELIQEVIDNNYCKTDSISIDYGILEKDKDIYVIPCDIEWDDIGTWKAVERYKEKDINNNIIDGDIKVIESKSNIAINNEKKMVMIGIEDIMTIETEDSIYIVNKDYMNNLRDYKSIV